MGSAPAVIFTNITEKAIELSDICAVIGPALIKAFEIGLAGPRPPDPRIDELALQAFSSGSYLEMIRVNWLYDWYLTLSVGQIAYQLAIFGRFLLGLYAARTLLLSDLKSHHTLFSKLAIWGGLVGLGANIVTAGHFLDPLAARGFVFPFLRRSIAEIGFLSLTVAYASGLALLFQTTRWQNRLRVLAPVGQMALTSYLLQTLIGLWWFYGFMPGPNLMAKVGPTWLVLIWLSLYALQVWLASVWLRRFRFGPVEWVWRSLTYWKRQSLKSSPATVT